MFSWIVFKSRAHRDRVNAKVMKDKRLAGSMDPKSMPFDVKRMIYDGFTVLLWARRTPMPTYMVQASYTNTAWNKLVQRPENRMEALKPVVEKLGGQVLAWYYTFGDYDVLVLFDVPSAINAAAFSMAIAGSGAVKEFKTTVLMSPDEGFDALLLAQGAGYRPPGG